MILLVVIVIDLLAGMEFDLFTPSFPMLATQFGLTPFLVELLLSVNFIGFCGSLFFVGSLADRYGRKPILLFSIAIFIIGSVLCLTAQAYPLLLMGRFLQGIGVSAPSILSFLIIADAYPLKQQQYYMAMLNAVMNIAAGLAPVLGSYITLYFQWRGNFMALLLLGIAAFLMIILFIPTTKTMAQSVSDRAIGYLAIFKSKSLLLLIIHIVCMCIPYWIFVGMSPLLYMQNLGVSLSLFGFYQGSLAAIFAAGCVLIGFVIKRYQQRLLLWVTLQIFVIGFISIVAVIIADSRSPLLITLAIIPFIIGQIIPSTILYPLSLNLIPAAKARVAAIIQASRLIFSALGLQGASYYYQGTFRSIGISIALFMLLGCITLYQVIMNEDLMQRE